MPAHDLPVRLSDGFQRGEIFAAVDHVPREADNVLGTPPRLRQDFHDVAQRLAELAGEVLCFPRARACPAYLARDVDGRDRKSTRLNSSHLGISYAVFCLK